MKHLKLKLRSQQVQINWIRTQLDKAEKSGFTTDSKAQILKQAKDLLNIKP